MLGRCRRGRSPSAAPIARRADGPSPDLSLRPSIEVLRSPRADPAGDLLVLNTTRVRHARFLGTRPSGAPAEVLLIHPAADGSWVAIGQAGQRTAARASGSRLAPTSAIETVEVLPDGEPAGALRRAHRGGGDRPLRPAAASAVHRRATRPRRTRTATRRSMPNAKGSVAAPTAGLHFTPGLLRCAVAPRASRLGTLDLEVGPGTFKPVEEERLRRAPDASGTIRHPPRARRGGARDASRAAAGVWAVGTTVVRALESAAQPDGAVARAQRETRLLITPGLPVPRGGPPGHQLPPAPLHPAHAGEPPLPGYERDHGGVPSRGGGPIPLLLLRRRDGDPMTSFANPAGNAAAAAPAYVRALLEFLGDRDPLEVAAEQMAWLEGRTAGLSDAVLRRPEAPGKWSVVQVIQHLADTEVVYACRTRQILARTGPRSRATTRTPGPGSSATPSADLGVAMAQLGGTRAANLRLWRSLTPAERARVGLHSERGPETPGPADPHDGRARSGAPAADRPGARLHGCGFEVTATAPVTTPPACSPSVSTPRRASPARARCTRHTAKSPRPPSCRWAPTARCAGSPRRSRAGRRPDHARQHLPPAPPARRGSGPRHGRPARLHHLGPAHADRSAAGSRCSRSRAADHRGGRRRVPEPHRRHATGPSPRARDGDPVGAGRRHRDGSSTTWCRAGAARAGARGHGAHAPLAGPLQGAARVLAGGGREAIRGVLPAGADGRRANPARRTSNAPGAPSPFALALSSSKRSGPSSRAERTTISAARSLEGISTAALDRHRDRRAVGRRAEAGDAPHPGALAPELPAETPRYLMGVGFPQDLLEGIARGVDLFDCVAPRATGATAPRGSRRAASMCAARGSRALPGAAGSPSATARPARRSPRIPASPLRGRGDARAQAGFDSNVRFLIRLAEQARAHVLAGTFDGWSREWLRRYHSRGEP